MKTRKQIIEEFLANKAKGAVPNSKQVQGSTDSRVLKDFYMALARKDASRLDGLQDGIAEGYEKALGDGQNVTTDGDGGYLVPVELSTTIREKLQYLSPIRQIATVIPNIPAKLDLPFENALPTTYWVDEGEAPTQSKSTFTKKPLTPHKIGGFGKFSHESLVDTAVNPSLQSFVADRFALSLALKENDAYVNGDGDAKPYGFRSNQITPKTGAVLSTGNLIYQDLVNAMYGVHPSVRANGVWVMPTEGLKMVASMTDDSGRPIYLPAIAPGQPNTVLGKPVYEVTEIPVNLGSGTNQSEIWFGDFKNYIIGDREGMRVTFGTTGTDLEQDMISLVLFHRTAGLPTYGDAFFKLTAVPTAVTLSESA